MSLDGDFKEILFADLLQFYCLGGQTAAVSVRAADERGVESTGTFFIDGGVLVDARFDGREGAEAVRRAVRRLKRGAFQVELGLRSQRRTVHEPWSALVLEELRQIDGVERAEVVDGFPAAALADTFIRPSLRSSPTDEPGSGAALTPGRRPTPPAGIRADALPPVVRTPTPGRGLALVVRTPARGTAPVPASERPTPPAGVPVHSGRGPRSGARGRPGSGPHPSGSGPRTSPPRTTPADLAAGRTPATAPFSRIRRQPPPALRLRWFLVVGGALVVGGGLAVVAARLVAQAGAPSSVQPSPGTESTPAAVLAPAGVLAPAPASVSDTEVTFGMAAPFSGASRELGRQMKVGLEVAFAAANAQGGIHGRRVRLVALDDGSEPTRTREVMRELAEQRGVFGFVGNVGTPTSAMALPYALGRRMLFFGPFTGAPLLRKEPPDRTVFNYRASDLEETSAIVRYLVEVRRIRADQIAVLAQDDSYGEAGYQGVVRSLRQLRWDGTPVLRVTYQRNTTEVANAVARVLERKDRIRAVVMVATYRAAARFIEQVRAQRPQMLFSNVSFVGSQALAEELMQLGPRFAEGVIVTQVVPLPTSRSTGVLRYQQALASHAPGERPDFVSLEGYVVGNLLLEGLRRTGRDLSTDRLVQALEEIRGQDVGLGVPISFGADEHQGSHKVWGTVLDATGSYQPLDLD